MTTDLTPDRVRKVLTYTDPGRAACYIPTLVKSWLEQHERIAELERAYDQLFKELLDRIKLLTKENTSLYQSLHSDTSIILGLYKQRDDLRRQLAEAKGGGT